MAQPYPPPTLSALIAYYATDQYRKEPKPATL